MQVKYSAAIYTIRKFITLYDKGVIDLHDLHHEFETFLGYVIDEFVSIRNQIRVACEFHNYTVEITIVEGRIVDLTAFETHEFTRKDGEGLPFLSVF